MLRRLATFFFNKGYRSSGPQVINDTTSLGGGSENLIFTGTGANRVFKGLLKRTGSPDPVGSKVLMNVGDSYGGLGQSNNGTALGSIFRVLGAIFYIGAGRLFYNGVAQSTSAPADINATSTLKLQRFVSGSLENVSYDAGLPQPSAPTIVAITPPTGFVGKNDGTVSVKIARVRSATGARSLASLVSNVVVTKNQSVLVQFPIVEPGSGQDYWEVDVTLNGYGGVGNHYFLTEVKESDIASSTVTATATVPSTKAISGATNASPIAITATAHGFATNDVVFISGVGGNTAANGYWTITKTGTDTFTLNSSTGNGAYTSGGNVRLGRALSVPNASLTSANVGWSASGLQTETITCVGTVSGTGDAQTVVTATGMTGSPKTLTFAVTSGDTPADVAEKLKVKLAGDSDVTAVFNVYRDAATVYLQKKSGTDTAMNFTIDNSTSAGITPVTTSSTVTMNTWVTAVGAADSASVGNRLVTVDGNISLPGAATDSATFTRAASGYARSYVFEWRDADLAAADLAPFREYPPPAALFGGVSGDVVFVDGAFGDSVNLVVSPNATSAGGNTPAQTDPKDQPGNAIAVSDPVKPEAFPPDNYLFTGDSPTAILEGSQGVHWRFAKNSLGVIKYIGGQPALSYERLWNGIGIQNQNNATTGAGGRLYAYTGTRGAVRMGVNGEPDTSFAMPVTNDMEAWIPANVSLGYDANYQYVLFAHNQTILAYFEPMDIWCAPLNLSATLGAKKIRSMVTINSEVYIAAGEDSVGGSNPTIDLYKFDAGTGTTGKLVTHWQQSSLETDILSRIRMAVRSDASQNMTVRAYTNGGNTARLDHIVPLSTGIQIPTTIRPNVRNAKMWKIEANLAATSGDSGWETITVEGETSGITF